MLSEQARRTIELETDSTADELEALATVVHRDGDLAAPISSGSFKTDGMLVIPCSIKSASAIAYGFNANLLVRAADVCLKEKRRLVLVVRETPLHLGHLRTLTQLAELGAVILPPVPGWYARPQTVDDVVAHTVGKALDQFGIDAKLFARWTGLALRLVALAIAVAAILSMLAQNRDLRRTIAAGDFPAFYCGAVVARERLDPYRAAPLEACERARTVAPGTTPLPNGIAPAPLPGYVLALVVPLSLLPFGVAAFIWYALLIAAVVATVELLRALTGLPRAALAAAVLGTEVVASVTYGQLAPARDARHHRGRARAAARAVAPRRAGVRARAAAAASRARPGRGAAAVAPARAHRRRKRRRGARADLARHARLRRKRGVRAIRGRRASARGSAVRHPAQPHVAAGVLRQRRVRGAARGVARVRRDARRGRAAGRRAREPARPARSAHRRPRGGGGARRNVPARVSARRRAAVRARARRARFRRHASTRGSPWRCSRCRGRRRARG